MQQKKPLVLIVLDGWGYRDDNKYNAINAAITPHWDKWWQEEPHCLLQASGEYVGLPAEQMGNSEVGHMHIGAGRIIRQDFTRINEAIRSGEFATNPIFQRVIDSCKQQKTTLHIMGLLSNGGVHSHADHLYAFLAYCHAQQFNRIALHLFLDGRDTAPQSALDAIAALKKHLKNYPGVQIASISGRYFAMDRDKRWERIALVYHLLTSGQSTHQFKDATTAINYFYADGKTDEFIPPTRIGEGKTIEDGDAVFFFNFRADRARQLTQAFVDDDFNGFLQPARPALSHFVSMTRYSKDLLTEIAFAPESPKNTFGELVACEGLNQLRIAETEKYAHVTFFFNGGNETPFTNEDRILIPSPQIATYDLLPQMSAVELTHALVDAIESDAYDVIVCNYANADMVGHSGDFTATVAAIECIDQCLNTVWQAIKAKGGAMLVTADHGNAEIMFDETTQQAHTAHTCQPVPLLYLGGDWYFKENPEASLIDIAPTLLALLDIPQPPQMTGTNLLVEKDA